MVLNVLSQITKRSLIALLIFFISTNLYSQKVKFVCKEKGTKIKVLDLNYYSDKIDTTLLGADSTEYKLKADEVLVYLENKGFKSISHLITKKEIKNKKNRIIFEPLLVIPQKEKSQKFITINKVSFNVNSKDYKKKYYESYATFMENKTEHSSTMDQDLKVEHTIFEDRLDLFLMKNGYVDTTNKLTLSDINNVEVNISINSITEHKIGKYLSVVIEGNFDLDNKIATKKMEFVKGSTIAYEHDTKNETTLKMLYQDALERTLIDIYDDPSLKEMFKRSEESTNAMVAKWSTITIEDKEDSPSLEKTVGAVVTVTQKNGHGSGCVISKNGYIVTNHHVVGSDTSGTFILFSNGVKKKCRVMRTNPLFDLALLKVDTIFENILKVNKDPAIKVGSDVYAIGTPKDIDLGQSVTKGIISAKRKIEGRDYIQTDVSINSGNSGGALTNKSGELIGIVNAKLVGRGVEGVGFAIPALYIEKALKIEIK